MLWWHFAGLTLRPDSATVRDTSLFFGVSTLTTYFILYYFIRYFRFLRAFFINIHFIFAVYISAGIGIKFHHSSFSFWLLGVVVFVQEMFQYSSHVQFIALIVSPAT